MGVEILRCDMTSLKRMWSYKIKRGSAIIIHCGVRINTLFLLIWKMCLLKCKVLISSHYCIPFIARGKSKIKNNLLKYGILNYFCFIIFYWICWGDLGSQNHTGFMRTTQYNVCALHCKQIAPSKVTFCPHSTPSLPTSTQPPPPFCLALTTLLSVCVLCIHGVCLERVQPLLIWQEWFAWYRCNLAAKESDQECACLTNDDFTTLVSGGGRRHRLSMCIVWALHSKWLSK